MRKKLSAAHAIAGLLTGAVLAVPKPAAAATPACSSFTNPVFISGSSASKPVLQALAKTIAADGLNVSIIYQNPDSCLGVNDLLTAAPSTEAGISTLYLGTDGSTTTACTLDGTTPQPVDIAVSDVFPATCSTTPLPSTVTEVQGPIQAMTFAVPGGTSGSSATSISAEAAYVVFGWDAGTYQVSPWSQAANIFVRAQTSGTLNMLGVAIGLAPSKWLNAATGSPSPQQKGSTGAMTTAISSVSTNQSATIGILSAEAVAAFNGATPAPTTPINILAYQHTGQSCGYLPDSSATALDKINVRQGRYAVWGPLHFLANVNGSNQPTGPDATSVATVLNYFIATGKTPMGTLFSTGSPDGGISIADMQGLITAEAKPGYVVPWCAMQVQRSAEIGAEASYSSPEPCSCLYETTLGSPVAGHTCTPCTTSANCSGTPSTPTCRYGFCEVQ